MPGLNAVDLAYIIASILGYKSEGSEASVTLSA
jgi:hypothetical protein